MTLFRIFARWLVTPSDTPINRVCSTIAAGLVLALVAVVVGVEIAR